MSISSLCSVLSYRYLYIYFAKIIMPMLVSKCDHISFVTNVYVGIPDGTYHIKNALFVKGPLFLLF
jgi:hypothetical protein